MRLPSAALAALLCAPLGAQFVRGNSNPSEFCCAPTGAFVLFAATGDTPSLRTGMELWRVDSPTSNPFLVKDIRPGITGSFPRDITSITSSLYLFSADDGTNGRELWKTDGTQAGTVMLMDIRPGPAGSHPTGLALAGSRVFFAADDGTNGTELWSSDGTTTALVKNIRPGPASSSSFPREFVALPGGARVVFAANDGTNGTELWVSDGTTAGTTLVKDIWPGTLGSTPSSLALVGIKVLFAATDPTTGRELWATDGTTAGTVLVADLRPGAASSSPSQITPATNCAWFTADDGTTGRELWRIPTVPLTPVLVKDIRPGRPGANIRELTADGADVFFSADDGTNGVELWLADSATINANLVKNIAATGSSFPRALVRIAARKILFTADGSGTGDALQLWTSDGKVANTNMVKAIRSTCRGARPADLYSNGALLAGVAFFSAEDDTNGIELWRSDATAAGTQMVADLNTLTPKQMEFHANNSTPLAPIPSLRLFGCDCQPLTPVFLAISAAPIQPESIPPIFGIEGTIRVDLTTTVVIPMGNANAAGQAALIVTNPPATLAGANLSMQAFNVRGGTVSLSDSASAGWGACAVNTGTISVQGATYDDESHEFELTVVSQGVLTGTPGWLGLIYLQRDDSIAPPYVPQLLDVFPFEIGVDDPLMIQTFVPLAPLDKIQVQYFTSPPQQPSGGCVVFQSYC